MIVDLYLVYQFVKRLATPFNKWKAFELGIIDDKGNILKPRKTLTTSDERSAFGIYDLMILNIKKTLAKIPGGATKLASYAAALYLIKEWNHFSSDSMLNESVSDKDLEMSMKIFVEQYIHSLFEDGAITNNVGSGNIAGAGVGPDGEPGLNRRQRKKYTDGNKTTPLKSFRKMIESADTEDTGDAFRRSTFIKNRKNKKHSKPLEPASIPLT